MDDNVGAIDLVLISLLSLFLWLLNRSVGGRVASEREPLEAESGGAGRGGRKFFWRAAASDHKLEMRIWRVRGSA